MYFRPFIWVITAIFNDRLGAHPVAGANGIRRDSIAFNLSRIYNLSPLGSHAPLDAEEILKAEKGKCRVDTDEREVARTSKEGILAAIDLQRRYKTYCQKKVFKSENQAFTILLRNLGANEIIGQSVVLDGQK